MPLQHLDRTRPLPESSVAANLRERRHLRPINNVVDVTNYIFALLISQCMPDLDTREGDDCRPSSMLVRNSDAGRRRAWAGSRRRSYTVADKPVALAASRAERQPKSLASLPVFVLEVAVFDGKSIRMTRSRSDYLSLLHALKKGLTANATEALDAAASMIADLSWQLSTWHCPSRTIGYTDKKASD